MRIVESPIDCILQEDLQDIAIRENIPFEQLKGSSVLVTGATGLVGSFVIKALACCNRMLDLNMTLYPFVRSEEKAKNVFGDMLQRDDLKVVKGDVNQPIIMDGEVDYIIHCASVTASKTFVTQPVETIEISIGGTQNVLKFAAQKHVKGMVYISSMEAFGITDEKLEKITEQDLGYIDVMNVRSCYSEGKRMCEVICAAYAHEYQVPVKVARLAQTFGAGVSMTEGRVFAQFAKSAMRGEDIVLHTKGESVGNYCYTADAVAGILTILLKGNVGEVYTVANPETSIKIKDMAKLVISTLGSNDTQLIFDIPKDALTYGYAPDVTMHLCADKLMALGWKPKYGLAEMYQRLAASFKEQGF